MNLRWIENLNVRLLSEGNIITFMNLGLIIFWIRHKKNILKKEKKAYLVQIFFFLGDNTLNQNSRIILINLAFRY